MKLPYFIHNDPCHWTKHRFINISTLFYEQQPKEKFVNFWSVIIVNGCGWRVQNWCAKVNYSRAPGNLQGFP